LSIAYLDTQIAVWLHAGKSQKLTTEARRQIERNDLLLSPMALLELQYLFDRQRIRRHAMEIYTDLHGAFGVTLCQFPFPAVAMTALSCTWTNDPFDRIIVSNAKANNDAMLLTADQEILKNYSSARW
jgi:PIN domain nuclease of toxin-antitoxin system